MPLSYSRSSYMVYKTPVLNYDIMFVSRVIFSGITLWPLADQLVEDYSRTSGLNYDDAIVSPLPGSENPSAVHIVISHDYYT